MGLSDSEVESDEDVVVEEAVKLPNTKQIILAAVKTGLLPSLRYVQIHWPVSNLNLTFFYEGCADAGSRRVPRF